MAKTTTTTKAYAPRPVSPEKLRRGDKYTMPCPGTGCGKLRELIYDGPTRFENSRLTLCPECRAKKRETTAAKPSVLAPCGMTIVPANAGRCHDGYHDCEHADTCLDLVGMWRGWRFEGMRAFDYGNPLPAWDDANEKLVKELKD